MSLEPIVVAGVFAAFFAGGVIKGMAGFGLPLVSLPLLTLVVDVRIALALMVVPIVGTNVYQTIQGGLGLSTLRSFWWLFLVMALGFPVGALLIFWLDPSLLVGLLGLAIAAFATFNLLQPSLTLPARLHRPVGIGAAFTGGVLGGLTTLFGPPLLMYLLALQLPHKVFMRLLGAIYLFGGVLLLVTYAGTSILTPILAVYSTLCIVPGILGMKAGQAWGNLVAPATMRRLTLLFLLLMGGTMLRNFF
ncbi:putative membrane protein YfcA [Natronocella acetinitrilica]|jgi:uncharacterized protein|uniref:Probable membrane transporter protein n=1 Tax=Natronocella acetinitrilica TaxID=414046 RepID=A0AAE3G7B3_9GAMM|nr:sulfite exporter TauE/SafE family protein [Natronocella acetinitrilica]MCP1675162.1 putative membrane protein YfcA [Natronocella acetinitrilica]